MIINFLKIFVYIFWKYILSFKRIKRNFFLMWSLLIFLKVEYKYWFYLRRLTEWIYGIGGNVRELFGL